MLVLIGVTPPPTTTTRHCRRQGAEADRWIHKKGHLFQQQQQRQQDADADDFDNEAPKPRRKQKWWYTNNGNYYGTPMATMDVSVLLFRKITSENEVLQYLVKVSLFLIIRKIIVFVNKTNKQIQYLWESKLPLHHWSFWNKTKRNNIFVLYK